MCLWGGLVCFGSSSRQASEADRSPKQCVDDVTKKDARPRGGTYNNRGERLAADFSIETTVGRWRWVLLFFLRPGERDFVFGMTDDVTYPFYITRTWYHMLQQCCITYVRILCRIPAPADSTAASSNNSKKVVPTL